MKALLAAVALALAAPTALAQSSDPVFDEDEVPWDEADPFDGAEAEARLSLGGGQDSAAGQGPATAGQDAAAPPPAPNEGAKKTPGPAAALALAVLGFAALALRRE